MGHFSIARVAGMVVVALGLSTASNATSLSFNGTVLVGVNGVQVGSTVYDVTFGDQALVSGDFFTFPAEDTASTALFNVLTDQYRINPYQITSINGCDGGCTAVVMSSSPYLTIYNYASYLNFAPNSGYLVTQNFAILPNTNMALQANETWTHWTAETTPVTSVPEPENYAMLLAGLCLVGTVVKRREAKET